MGSFEFCNLKECSRVSKDVLNKIISQTTKKTMSFNNTTFVYNCDNCPYKGLSKEQFEMNCNEFCTFKEIRQEVKISNVECITKRSTNSSGEEFSISMPYVVYDFERKSLPKTAIKVLLLYHFLNRNQFNIVKNVSLNDIADNLGVAVASIKRSNELLEKLNFIHIIETSDNAFDVAITGIDTLHFKKEDNGKGYLTMPKEKLIELLNINDVNILRYSIKEILIADYHSSKGKTVSQMSINTLKNVLPPYLCKSKKSIENIIKNKKSIFSVLTIDYKRSILETDISNYMNREKLRDFSEKSISKELEQFIDKNDICIVSQKEAILNPAEPVGVDYVANVAKNNSCTEKELFEERLNNLVSLAIEYGTQNIKNMLLHIKKIYLTKDLKSINNLGGFIRTRMLSHINNFGSCAFTAI